MKVGIIGLGRMGSAIAYRMVKGGHHVVAFDQSEYARNDAQVFGVEIADSIEDLAGKVHIFWLMVPAGDITDNVLNDLLAVMDHGDIVIDGGNSFYKNSIARSQKVQQKNGHFLDCGTSGGVRGRHDGFCLMIGGPQDIYEKVKPIFASVSIEGGFAHIGPVGSGHYVKMVHNGIEYGLMQAYAEGLHLIKEGAFKSADIDLHEVTSIWNKNAVIRSFLLELTMEVFEKDQKLKTISGEVAESGMGKWTVDESHDQNIPVKVIEESLKVRSWSRETGGNFGTKIVAMMRKKFGGHAVKKVDNK